MDDVHQTIQRTLTQYQRRLILHLLLLGGAGVACTVVLLWRLMQWGAPLWLQVVVALAGFSALAWWQWRVVRRTHLSRSGILLGLDRALGLEARLVTAAQFATVPHPPLLYARLVQDPALSPSELSKRLPRIADRRALFLGLLLFLFLWPWHRAPLAQLAMQTPTTTPPLIEPPTPPPTDAGTPEGGRGGSPEAAGRGTTSPQSQGDQRDSASSQSQQAQQGQGQESESTQTAQASSQRDAQSSGQQQQSGTSQQQLSGSSPAQQANAKEQSGAQRAEPFDSAQGSALSNVERAEQLGSQSGAAGAQMASANQEALKADIQQMLQELSTELKQLEAQLQATQHNQPNPAAGTSTDPNLYEQASPLERTSGRALPIQLDVDQQATASARKGGGVGRPSGQVADATPQQQPEEVALADQTSEEASGQRQAIPPEYRPVFERLSTP